MRLTFFKMRLAVGANAACFSKYARRIWKKARRKGICADCNRVNSPFPFYPPTCFFASKGVIAVWNFLFLGYVFFVYLIQSMIYAGISPSGSRTASQSVLRPYIRDSRKGNIQFDILSVGMYILLVIYHQHFCFTELVVSCGDNAVARL